MSLPICDCHVHVFGDGVRFPFARDRSYTPTIATPSALDEMHARLCVGRTVLVQPSVYGDDNGLLLETLRERGSLHTRAVITLPDDVTDSQLKNWHQAGVRGVRVNVLFRSGGSLDQIQAIGRRICALGWHLQLLVDVTELPDIYENFADFPTPVVFDHMGHFNVESASHDAGPQGLLRLLVENRCWVKVSAPYRMTDGVPEFAAVRPFLKQLCQANPDRLVWGSDWPHPGFESIAMHEAAMMHSLMSAFNAEHTSRILKNNPARLYDFK